jgi:hypothetical protein
MARKHTARSGPSRTTLHERQGPSRANEKAELRSQIMMMMYGDGGGSDCCGEEDDKQQKRCNDNDNDNDNEHDSEDSELEGGNHDEDAMLHWQVVVALPVKKKARTN